MVRSILGVVCGVATTFAIWIASGLILPALAPSMAGPDGSLMMTSAALWLMVIIFILSAITGSYLAAFMNMARPTRHALATSLVLLGTNVVFALLLREEAVAVKFHLTIAALTIPSGFAAGKIFLMRHPLDAPV